MKFLFVGDPLDTFSGPESVRVFGYEIGRIDPVEVDDSTAQKLLTHSHFEAVHGDVSRNQTADSETPGATPPRDVLKLRRRRASN